MRDRARIEALIRAIQMMDMPEPMVPRVMRLTYDAQELLAELDLHKVALDDVFPVAMRFGVEHHASDPAGMAQSISDHVTAQLRAERP